MPEEVGEFVNKFNLNYKREYGDLTIYSGIWKNSHNLSVKLSLAWSGWGKVSSARAATRLLSLENKLDQKVDLILFFGVAGSVQENLRQWDIILASGVIQHDLDARPLFDRYTIPALKKSILEPKMFFIKELKSYLSNYEGSALNIFGKVTSGLIGTGDKFISSQSDIDKLKNKIKSLKAVEMEGASVAQVAAQENIPWIVLRVISDNADESAANNFNSFLKVYKENSSNLLLIILEKLSLLIN